MPSIGPLEIVVVLVIALLVFGPSRLPEMSRNAGRAMRQFQNFQQGVRTQIDDAISHDDDDDDVDEMPPIHSPVAASDDTIR